MKTRTLLACCLLLYPLAALAKDSACRGAAYDLARKFEGTWQELTVTEDGEVPEGTLTSELSLDGCILQQRFTSRDGSFSFQTFGYVDEATGQWTETYVLKRSDVSVSRWNWRRDGNDIVTDRVGGRDLGYEYRLRITFVDDDLYEVRAERSDDGGNTWAPGELTRTRRVDAADEATVKLLTDMKHALGVAYVTGDVAALERIYTEDYSVIDGQGNTRTMADDIRALRAGDTTYEYSKYDVSSVRLFGDSAVLVGRGEVKGKRGEEPFHTTYVSTNVYVRRDGIWKIAAAHISGSRPVASE